MFGSDGNKGCCMAAGLYLMIINPGAKKFSAFLAACFCQSSKHLKCRSGPRVRHSFPSKDKITTMDTVVNVVIHL